MIEDYRRAVASDPNNPAHQYNLAAALHAKGKTAEALEILDEGICTSPQDACLHYGIACIQQNLGRNNLAEAAFRKATDLDPEFRDAWYGLGTVCQSSGDEKTAVTCYARVLALDHDHANAKHLLASLTGKTTEKPEPTYVEQLFDHYASHYEKHLLDELHYQGHTLAASALQPALKRQNSNNLLDLGCGTGLFGAEVVSMFSHLVGVDLSSEMIIHAKNRACYDELKVMDIEQFMLQSPPSIYDVVASVDVFGYLGDLKTVFGAIHRVLKPGGLLVFTAEAGTSGYRLGKAGRYQHSKEYLVQQAKQQGYEILSSELRTLRNENLRACEGWVCIWCNRKPHPQRVR